MHRLALVVVLLVALPLTAETTVTLLHFSDYHSHALPYYAGEEGERGGLARAIAYLRGEKERGALVFSGGDMINKGSPAWSDKYGCAEWPWLNGIVNAMAFGNHDADYGVAVFEKCRDAVEYPVLSANTRGFRQYVIFDIGSTLIGVFAVAGKDFPSLVKSEGLEFTDPVQAARETVARLRSEGVDAVVMIGHEQAEDDAALARAVPGIDLIFGSHSHLRRELTQIEGTKTWFISPGQYLEAISRVELTVGDHAVTHVRGELIPVTSHLAEDGSIGRKIRRMQRQLAKDSTYAPLFQDVARLPEPLPLPRLAERTLQAMRDATKSDIAFSTISSFRQALPSGNITAEQLRAALPYDNEIIVSEMTGAAVQRILDENSHRKGSDSELYLSLPGPLDPSRTYRVATTDYLAHVAYRDLFPGTKTSSGLRVRSELQKAISKS
ncbi:MAG: 5-nucleotidase / UDP-sugar diphosphatase [Acidobacteriota bacterium]|jgi:5'-nucleotidase|nr:5-nucleotidase / UDP-sugar diphosphatase [Acidobacteriota bacterium]